MASQKGALGQEANTAILPTPFYCGGAHRPLEQLILHWCARPSILEAGMCDKAQSCQCLRLL